MTRRLLVSSLLAGLLVGCASVGPSIPDSTADPGGRSLWPSHTVSTPATPAAAGSTPAPPTPTSSTSAVPSSAPPASSPALPTWSSAADDLAWHRLGTIPTSLAGGLVGYTHGYVALEGPAAWYSKVGRSW